MGWTDKEIDPVDRHVGQRIRAIRMAKGVSQERLAEPLGVTFQQLQKYERGVNRVSASRLQQIAQALECSISDFFDGLPSTGVAGGTPGYITEFLASREGRTIAEAMQRISNPALRRAIVGMTVALSEA